MHSWGDKWGHWEDLGAAIDMVEELARKANLPVTGMKEKFGTLRWYYTPRNEADEKAYRQVYEQVVEKYPHLAPELLSDADSRELLVGIVDPKDCKHEAMWTTWGDNGAESTECGVCMKQMEEV